MSREKMTQYRTRVFDDIEEERDNQDAKFGYTPESILPRINTKEEMLAKLSVLTEEVGEVAMALNDMNLGDSWVDIKEELVQVAAVAVKWLESMYLDEEG